MVMEGQTYTLGIWKTKKGRETEFIEAWQSFANWTSRNLPGAGDGTLLQHEGTPQRFVSFGPWEDAESVAKWREQPRFNEFVAKAQELCEAFEPQNMILVGHSTAS
jgi:heme-degrading monooxygenase HmoA